MFTSPRRTGLVLVVAAACSAVLLPAAPAVASGGGGGGGGGGTPALPVLTSVTFAPASVTGGGFSTGTLTFGSVTDGAVVSLSSSDPLIASVPSESVVNGGQSRGAFPVTTSAVAVSTQVTITASVFGVTRTGTLNVNPGTPPAADTVTITRATWKARLLRIEATTSNPNAILSVQLSSNDGFMFLLTNLGGGRYADQRGWLDNPIGITVHSNFGGSASARVANG